QITPPGGRVDHRQMAPTGQKRLRRKPRRDVWPKVCHRLTTPRNRHPFATGDPIDDIAAVIAQFADSHFAHAERVSRVRQRRRGGKPAMPVSPEPAGLDLVPANAGALTFACVCAVTPPTPRAAPKARARSDTLA